MVGCLGATIGARGGKFFHQKGASVLSGYVIKITWVRGPLLFGALDRASSADSVEPIWL